jgi:HAD superfamily hydrolase (TIGR01509 family)
MDGLLFNTEELFDEIGIAMLSRRGKELDPELVKCMMGQQANIALQMFIDHYDLSDSVDDLKRETDELFDDILPKRLAPMPGAVKLLERLTHNGSQPLALTTSSGAASVDRIMSICDLSAHFHFRLTAEDVGNSKPHPEIYETAAEWFKISPSEMLVFEDSENGCRSGVAAGANVVAVPSKYRELHDFDGCLFVAESLNDPRIGELLS